MTSLTQYSHGGNCKFIIIHLFKFLTAFDGFAAAGEALDIAKKKGGEAPDIARGGRGQRGHLSFHQPLLVLDNQSGYLIFKFTDFV